LTDDQKQQFRQMMNFVFENYRQPKPSVEMLRYWWGKLEGKDLDTVSKAMDSWLESKDKAPTIADILDLCRHKVTIFPKLPSPLNVEENRHHAEEVKRKIDEFGKPKRDMKDWARKILASQKGRPEIAIRFAQEALHTVELPVEVAA
jgi:hypothetical protein